MRPARTAPMDFTLRGNSPLKTHHFFPAPLSPAIPFLPHEFRQSPVSPAFLPKANS